MKIRFNKQITVDFLYNQYDEVLEKTFKKDQIVEVSDVVTSKNFIDLVFENGDTALGIPKQGLTIL